MFPWGIGGARVGHAQQRLSWTAKTVVVGAKACKPVLRDHVAARDGTFHSAKWYLTLRWLQSRLRWPAARRRRNGLPFAAHGAVRRAVMVEQMGCEEGWE